MRDSIYASMQPESPQPPETRPRVPIFASLLVTVIAFGLYTLTAFRTITWWNSSEYSLSAITLGIQAPPGSLLCTLLGWAVVQLPLPLSDIFSLNLLAGVFGALAAGIVFYVAVLLFRISGRLGYSVPTQQSYHVVIPGMVLGGLTFAFSETLWLYTIKYTPYVLTALFTALIVWAMVRWWQEGERSDALSWLFVITLLFGLDISVHRTNLLLFPGLFVWVALRRGRTFRSIKAWGVGSLGLLVGFAVHLTIIPISMREPFLNMSSPNTLAGFIDYISLKQAGGGFLFKLWPRNAAFFDLQVMDYLRAFSVNFFTFDSSRAYLGLLPGIIGLIGFVSLWRRRRPLAIGLLVLFLLSSAGAIAYFNIPANYFRSLHRHYLPSFVIFSVWIAYGAGAIMFYVCTVRSKVRTAIIAVILALLVV